MTKRLIPLLVLTFLILSFAPAALANHCERCKPLTQTCVPTLNFGFAICYWDIEGCHTDLPCGDHSLSESEPLAAEFTVAAVERLDEPKPEVSETLAASVEAPAPAIR